MAQLVSNKTKSLWDTMPLWGSCWVTGVRSRSQIVSIDIVWKCFVQRIGIPNLNTVSYIDKFFTGIIKICRQTDRQTDSSKTLESPDLGTFKLPWWYQISWLWYSRQFFGYVLSSRFRYAGIYCWVFCYNIWQGNL